MKSNRDLSDVPIVAPGTLASAVVVVCGIVVGFVLLIGGMM